MTTLSSALWDWLPGGFCPRRDAVLLARQCEDDGIGLRVVVEAGGAHGLRVDGEVSMETLAELRRLKAFVIPVLKFRHPDRHHFDHSVAPPDVGPVVTKKEHGLRGAS